MEETDLVVWVFNGARNKFPSAVFADLSKAQDWIRRNKLTGTLTAYPIDQGIYEWAINKGYFRPRGEDQKTASFIGNFSSASQEHYHYENGE